MVRLSNFVLSFLCLIKVSIGYDISINHGIRYQTIDGFGGSNAFNTKSGPMTSEEIKLLFDPVDGIGLTLLRTQIPNDGSCIVANSACVGINTIRDIESVKEYPVKIWATPWSPPGVYKTNGRLSKKHYKKYAEYLHNYAKSVKNTTGVQLYAISVQNEPNARVKWATAKWTPNQFKNFIAYLRPVLNKSTRILAPETASWSGLRDFKSILNNNDIVAFHNYDFRFPTKTGYQFGSKTLWQTEVCDLKKGHWDPSMEDAIYWGINIHTWLVKGNLNAWHWWWLTGRPDSSKNKLNQFLINEYNQITKRLYVIGHYSKFIRPGYIRVQTSSSVPKGVLVSAYISIDASKIVLVVINKNNVDIEVNINGGVFTPWVTSKDLNLVAQNKINNTFILIAQSVTTFVNH